MNNLLDKNKSVYKLQGLPPIYYINLDKSEDRKRYMEDQFEYWQIENYTRISGYDGTEDDLSDILRGKYPDQMNSRDVGCCTSHLKAIQHWYETSDTPCAIIMEDDCDLGPVSYWPFVWKDFYSRVPFDYDVVQLAVINPATISLKLHRRFVNDFSTACYMITRHHASKLVKYYCKDGKYKLDYNVRPRCCSEHVIYQSGSCYAIPLFLYSKEELGSMIHDQDHINAFHVPSRDGLWQFWKTQAASVDNWNEIFEFDPYYGTLPPGFDLNGPIQQPT